MDFARKQLEKYGWTEGKGLGKHENGISQALKPKIKRSVTGVGHDPASEFNEHWWSALYDKAAANVEVEESNGKTKKIKTKDDLTISTNTWQINKGSKKESQEQYSDFFVRTAVISKGGNVEKLKDSDSEEDVEMEKKDALKMTDEELFAACEGRTAHKGARHGLKATGKLARIAQQEAMLLSQSRFSGYSHAKKAKEPVDDAILNPEEETTSKKKKKKKRRRCFSNEILEGENCNMEQQTTFPKETSNDTSNIVNNDGGSKSQLCNDEISEEMVKNEDDVIKTKKKKKRKMPQDEPVEIETDVVEIVEAEVNVSKKKKKKKKYKETE